MPYTTPASSEPAPNVPYSTPQVRLAVCILHYGDPGLAARLQRQFVEAEPERGSDIKVLDNHAPLAYPHAWKRLAENLYWPGAFAFALGEFGKSGFTHVWFCNNDAELFSPAPYIKRVEARLQWLEKQCGPVGILSPSLTQNPYHPHMVHSANTEYAAVPYIDGVAPVVNIAAVNGIGGLDYEGNPYGYGVDLWLSLCLARKGWGVLVDHSLVIRHRYHTTAGKTEGFMSQAARYEESYMAKRMGEGWRESLAQMRGS